MKNYTITVNGVAYEVTVEEGTTGAATAPAAAPKAAPKAAPAAPKAAAPAAAPVAAAQDDSEIIAVIAAAVAACGVSADQIACVRRIDAKSAWTVSSRVEAISVRKECF